MQAYNNIKNFIATVTRATLKSEKQIRMTIDDAIKLQADINLLLLELKENTTNSNTTTLDGGKF